MILRIVSFVTAWTMLGCSGQNVEIPKNSAPMPTASATFIKNPEFTK